MDGWITIGTDIDTDNFEKELNRLQKESEKFEKEEERLLKQKGKLEIDTSKAERDMDNLEAKINNVREKLKKEQINLDNMPKWKQDTPEYSKQSAKIGDLQVQYDTLVAKSDTLNDKYQNQVETLNNINSKLLENAKNQEYIKGKIEDTKQKTNGLDIDFNNIGKSIMENIKKVGKWALAIFSIRSAYSLVRQAMSTISGYNDDINNKLYSMRMIFASALEPLVTNIVNLFWKLMSYVAYILKAWFGIDILAKASANSMKSGAKSAEKMKKTLAGFDEMNVLNENGTTGAAGASGPKFEMPDMSEENIPTWIKWIADNKDKVLNFFKELGLLWAAIKVAGFILNLKKLKDGLFGVAEQSGKSTSAMASFGKMIGSALIIGGLVLIATHMFNLIKNWNDMTAAEKNGEIALVLLGVAFVALGLTIRGAIDTASFGIAEIIGLIVALVATVGGLIFAIASEEESIKSVDQAQKDLKTSQEELKQATDDYVGSLNTYDNALKKAEESARLLADAEQKNKISGEELFNQVQDGTLKYQDMNEQQKEVYKAYMNNEQAQKNLAKSTAELDNNTSKLTEAKKKEKIASWESKLAHEAESGSFDNYKKSVVEAFENGELSADEARDLIGKSMSDMSRNSQKTFTQDLPNDIKEGLNPKNYETTWQKFKKGWDDMWTGITSGASNAWKGIKGTFGFASGGIAYRGGIVRGFAKGGISYPKLQYLASGAIINQPGRGVPITQAIGGERGAEGILPLTDSQQMDLLGSAIARHMNINATIPIYMGNRQIAREIQKINAQQEFAANN